MKDTQHIIKFFKAELKRLREEKGLTIEELSKLSKIPVKTLSDAEEKGKMITAEEMSRLMLILDVTANELLTGLKDSDEGL